MYKKHGKTRLISCRIDEKIYEAFKYRNLNLNYTINELLEGYLYIQKYSDNPPIVGSSDYSKKKKRGRIVFDFYDKDFLDWE